MSTENKAVWEAGIVNPVTVRGPGRWVISVAQMGSLQNSRVWPFKEGATSSVGHFLPCKEVARVLSPPQLFSPREIRIVILFFSAKFYDFAVPKILY